MSEHTKEPWRDDDRGHGVVAGFDGKTTAMSNKTIATANNPKDSRLEEQRDELLAALTSVVNHPNTFNWETIRALLAKIEGEKNV